MSDEYNGVMPDENEEKLSRADKIKRIKNSLRTTSDSVPQEAEAEEVSAAEEAKAPAEKTEAKAESSVSEKPVYDWENALSDILAKKQNNAASGTATTAESILAELGMLGGGEKAPVPEKAVPEVEPVSHVAEAAVPEAEPVSHAAEPIVPESEPVSHAAEAPAAAVVSHAAEPEKPAETPALEEVPEVVDKKSKKKNNKKKSKKPFKEKIRDLFPRKEDKLTEKIRKVVFLCSIVAIVVCGYLVGDYYLDLWKSKKLNEEVMNIYSGYEPDIPSENGDNIVDIVDDRPVYVMLDGAKKLLDLNSDIVGVIRIPDTPVNNPVLKASNNEKYLDRKLNGDKSRAGEVFMDYRNNFYEIDDEGHMIVPNSDNIVIYGHNMGDETMFGSLKSYNNYDYYYGKHPLIYLNSNYGHMIYKIFAFFIVDAEDKSETAYDCWNKFDFSNEKEFYNFVNEAKKRTIRTNDVDVEYGDKLLTLSTCNTLLGDRGRLIVMARLLRDGEDLLVGTQNSEHNENIKWPSLYYTYRTSAKKYDPEAEFIPYGPSDKDDETADGTTTSSASGSSAVTTTTTSST